MSQESTPLFRKPWGVPEYLLVALLLAVVDAFTPNIQLLPFIGQYLEMAGAFVRNLFPTVNAP